MKDDILDLTKPISNNYFLRCKNSHSIISGL